MKNYRTELSQRVRYAIIAGMAGAFLIPQIGFAAPTGEHDYTAGVQFDRNTANTTKITATAANNVINWQDYSVNQGETVQYDGGAKTNNYLNIVTGANTSNINGKIEGGKDVYIVNPNGVIFGKTAEVNVGNLYVSTQEKATLNEANFTGSGASPLVNTAALQADVVNMGKITADTVEVHGAHIRFLNAADVVTSANAPTPVKVYTAAAPASATSADGGYVHIGYRGAAPTNYTSETTNVSPEYYVLVGNKSELDAINSSTALAGSYMLENDIDLGGAAHTPIGTTAAPFTGKLDGNFFQIRNFTATDTHRAGLFGEISNARIENLGVTGASVTGAGSGTDYAGGIAGYASGSLIKNVYIKDSEVIGRRPNGSGGIGYVGGIVGAMTNTTIDSAYSKSSFTGNAGGIAGSTLSGSLISNSYNDSEKISASEPKPKIFFLYAPSGTGTTTITNSYNVGTDFSSNKTRLRGGLNNVYELDTATNRMRIVEPTATPTSTDTYDAYASSTYSSWGNAINNTGAPGAKWRIYEGRTLPLLTAFMSGSSAATYDYRYFKADGTPSADTGNTVQNNGGADITAAYNSHYLKAVDKGAPDAIGGKANASFGAGADTSAIIDYVSAETHDLDRTNGIRNAGTKAIFWTGQDGPNLRGVNVTVTPREVKLDGGTVNPKRMYNGKSDVTQAFIDALTSGDVSSSGFTKEDIANHTVTLDFATGNFKAEAYDKATGTHKDKNVDEDKPVKFSGTISFSGTDAGNYTFNGSSLSALEGKATITQAPLYLAIGKTQAEDKIYDGTYLVRDNDMLQTKPNITLDTSKAAPLKTDADQTILDGSIMRNDDDALDTVSLTDVGGPKYTDENGVEQIHVGNHKLQYTGVGLTGADARNYKLYYTPADGRKKEVTGGNVYLDGRIIQRQVLRDGFHIYDKDTHDIVTAQRVYDGTDVYTPVGNVYLSSNAVANGSTGIVERDREHISFVLKGDGTGHFTQADGTTRTKNVSDAAKIAYEVVGEADNHVDTHGGHLLSDYYIVDGTTRKSLDDTFSATGDGKITPKALTATVVNQHISKTYDAMQAQTDGRQNITRGDSLVTLDGFVTVNGVKESRTNTSTAQYASKDVVVDGSGNPRTQSVTYTASFDAGTGVEAQNYTLGTEGALPIATSRTLTGGYTGTIRPRELKMTFNDATKVYDGTADNTRKELASLDDGLSGAVVRADNITTASFDMTNVTSRFGTGNTAADFRENVNAGSRTVEYKGLSTALGTTNHNYTITDTQYGAGEITRRRIDKSGFKVYNADGSVADASKVYDGNDRYSLGENAYLTATQASGDTGIVTRDYGKVTFTLKTGSTGHFASDADGNNRTSHVSEAHYVAYDVVARTSDEENNPLTNYTFGSAAEETAHTLRNLETVNDADPAHVTADGSIKAAKLTATTHEISKVYDGMQEHTDGSRNIKRGSDIVSLAAMITDETDGQPTNTSAASYANKDVARDSGGNIIKQSVTYTAQLTGQYADDYEIVNAGGTTISAVAGTGAGKTLTADLGTVADAGTITPRALTVEMNRVSKTYDGTANHKDTAQTEVTKLTSNVSDTVLADILLSDNVTASRLTTRYRGMMTASPATATSTYGRGTNDGDFTADVNASNGTDHDVQYQNMGTAFRTEFGTRSAGNYTVDETAYGKGTILRRDISPNNFQVRDVNNNLANATKVYDGTSSYTLKTGDHLTPSSGPATGIIDADQNDVYFALGTDGAQFADSSDNPTANVADATKVIYNVEARGRLEKIRNYTLNGVALESGKGKVSGVGSIERRTINVGLAETAGINKVYDRSDALVNGTVNGKELHHNVFVEADAQANVGYAAGAADANKLVRKAYGYTVDDGAQVTVEARYADKNVARNPSGDVIAKNITYDVKIAGGNYKLSDGTTTVNAEDGLTLSATGTIAPKDLSGAFEKVTKVYDGTTSVPSSQVGFKAGAVIGPDVVTLRNGYGAAFESANVRGSGTSRVIDGNAQHNWVNYTNVALDGADAGNYEITPDGSGKLYGLGEITPRALDADKFKVDGQDAEKVYDGTSVVPLDGKKLTPSGVGLIAQDEDKIKFEIDADKGAKFTDNNGAETANAYEATKAIYHVKATATSGNDLLLGNYTLNDNALDSGTMEVSGAGKIHRRVLNVGLDRDSGIDKEYDGKSRVESRWEVFQQTPGADGNVKYADGATDADKLVTTDGTSFHIEANYRNDLNTDSDKNVRGTSAAPQAKDIRYEISITGGDARNYAFQKGSAEINAEDKLRLDATGTINPKDLTHSFARIPDKVYDGNTNVDASQVRFITNAVISGDDVTLATHDQHYQSENVNGDGVNTWTPTAGEEAGVVQKNWVNYSNLTLGGTDARNYKISPTAQGLGRITPLEINGNVTFTTTQASKIYDGTRNLDPVQAKQYITGATVNGTVLNRDDFSVKSAVYESANVNGGAEQNVAYEMQVDETKGNLHVTGSIGNAPGKGIIKRRVLNVELDKDSGIDKEYDGATTLRDTETNHWNALTDTDAKGNVKYADGATDANKLVTTDGTAFEITSQYLKTGTESSAKDVNRDSSNNVIDKNIQYDIRITGGDASNYSFRKGGVESDAEIGLTLTAKGKITPRKLNIAMADVSKVYDGTSENTNNTTADAVGTVSSITAQDGADIRQLLSDDGITGSDLGTAWRTRNSATNPLSHYGRGTNPFERDVNASNGRAHDVQYTDMKAAFAAAFGTTAGNYEVENDVYGKGTIARKNISGTGFTVNGASTPKVYDGTSNYDVHAGQTLTPATGELLTADAARIHFDIDRANGAHFTKDDGKTQTANVAEAKKIAYNIIATADAGYEDLLKNYTLNGENLEKGTATVTGDGTITRRTINVGLAETAGIDKVYDGSDALVNNTVNGKELHHNVFVEDDAKANVGYAAGATDANKLVRKANGYTVDDGAQVTVQGRYTDKKAVSNQNITYDVRIAGDAGKNYTLAYNDGTTIHTADAEVGLPQVTATGSITPRKLNIAMADVSKVYDGTSDNTNNTTADAVGTVSSITAQDGADIRQLLSDDGITGSDLGTAWRTRNSATNPLSHYGRGTNPFERDVNASNGRAHDVQYTDMKAAFAAAFGTTAGNYEVENDVYGKGTIARKNISGTGFTVDGVHASKTYDGTSAYNLAPGQTIRADAGGLLTGDESHIHFSIDTSPGKGAKFTKTDEETEAKNVADAERVVYHVIATADAGYDDLLGNYTLNGEKLEDGAKVSGAGTINRRVLNVGLVQKDDIDKPYDGNAELTGGAKHWNALTETDADGNVRYAAGSDKLVAGDGTRLNITSEYLKTGNEKSAKDVNRDSSHNVIDKQIRYNISIVDGDETDVRKNYMLSDGTNPAVNAEDGLTLSATGKITPKDLTHSFEKVTKVYDGTTDVPSSAVRIDRRDIIAGDKVDIAREGADRYTASFESPDVGGGTATWTAPDGSVQHNWVNYGNLHLTGDDAGNYHLESAAHGLGEITPAPPVPEFHIPDADYYRELTQTSKMLPDEYAYENASLDRRSHFGRKPEAEVSYEPPSINMVQDGMNLGTSDILVTDRAVFEIVNEVFG